MEKIIELAGFIPASAADGPGVRSVLFLQGCCQNCPDCHNQAIQKHGQGISHPISQVAEDLLVRCRNRKLTISGGEPMEQVEALMELVSLLAERGFDLCLYTSFEVEKVPSAILKHLHYLKTGPFLREYIEPPKPYVGSNNQRIYCVSRKGGTLCLSEI